MEVFKLSKVVDGLILVSIIIGVYIILNMKGCNSKPAQTVNLYKALEDTIKRYKDELGRVVNETSVLQASNTKLFLSFNTKNKDIIELQGEVKKYQKELKNGGSVTIIGTETNFNSSSITNVTETKPVKIGDTVFVYPVYSTDTIKNKWVTYKITSSKDSSNLYLKIKNNYTFILGEKREKLFSKKIPFVSIISDNPYEVINKLKTFEVKDERKLSNFGIGVGIGVGIGWKTKQIQPCLSIGATYLITKF